MNGPVDIAIEVLTQQAERVLTRLWIAGQATAEAGKWEFAGVFDSEAAARDACRDETYFIGPAELNVRLPHESMTEWLGAYFPKAVP